MSSGGSNMTDMHKKMLTKIGPQLRDGQGCVICGHRDVTKEDVLPKWLQKRYGISSQKFLRPSGTHMNYGKLKVSLCATCNNQDFSQLELTVSKLFRDEFDSEVTKSRELQIWLTKIYYFLELFEQSRFVYKQGEEPVSLVSDTQIFDAHLLQLLLKSVSSNPPFIYPDLDFASVWAIECSEAWDQLAFSFASSSGQNIVALKIGRTALFAVVGDWGQYKIGGALGLLEEPIGETEFRFIFELLRFFVDRNRISTSFATASAENSDELHLLPLMIQAEEMDFSLVGFNEFVSSSWPQEQATSG